jgi:hypothetical protein
MGKRSKYVVPDCDLEFYKLQSEFYIDIEVIKALASKSNLSVARAIKEIESEILNLALIHSQEFLFSSGPEHISITHHGHILEDGVEFFERESGLDSVEEILGDIYHSRRDGDFRIRE